MKGMIFAAGRGERLKPMTLEVPKPLFPVVNIPIIRYNIELLKKYGITEIAINLFHLPRLIEQELGDGSSIGVRLTYSHEEELWGTGGGLKRLENYFAQEDCFVAINADILIDCDLEDAIHFHRRHQATATMVLNREAPVKLYGAVDIDENFIIRNIAGRLDDVREGPRISAVFTGIHILSPRIFEYIPPNINSCINQYAYPKMIGNGERVMGYISQGYWTEIGRPETYYAANMAFLDRKVQLLHFDPFSMFTLKPAKSNSELVCLGENVELGQAIEFVPPLVVGHNVRIGDQTKIGPYAIIGDNCQIGKQAMISDSIVLADNKIGNKQRIMGLVVNRKQKLRVPFSASNTAIMDVVES